MTEPTLMRKKVFHRCVGCGKEYPHQFMPFCTCGALIDVFYDLAQARLYDSYDPLERFFDLLPIENPDHLISLRMHMTPCIHATKLGARLGIPHLYLKNEAVLPTGTTKDRMAAVALSYLHECGVDSFCTSSTGNSSTAYAHALARFPEMRMFLFTAEDFASRVQYEPSERSINFVLRGSTFVDAFDCAAAFAKRHHLLSEGGFFNPGRREGLKLAYLEATEQVPGSIDWYVQAVSSAMGVYGAYKGARELQAMGKIRQLPRLLCVQQETCAPMVHAFHADSPTIRQQDIVPQPSGIAEAILRGNPTRTYPYIYKIVCESEGAFVAVSEREIRIARELLEDEEGLTPCFSAAAALAGMVRMIRAGTVRREQRILVNLTGSDRPASSAAPHHHWLQRNSAGWQPEDPTDMVTTRLWNTPLEAQIL